MKTKNILLKVANVIMHIIAGFLLSIVFYGILLKIVSISKFSEAAIVPMSIVIFVISVGAAIATILYSAKRQKKIEAEKRLRGEDGEEETRSNMGWVSLIAQLVLLALLSYGVGYMVYLLMLDILYVI